MDELLRMGAVSALTGIPINTLRYWRNNPAHDKGPRSARLGSRVVYRKADVVAWVDAAFEAAESA